MVEEFIPDQWKRMAIRRMCASRTVTLKLLSELSAAQINRPRTQGAWSIKDVMAHFVAWEEEAVKRLRLIRQGKADQVHFFDDRAEADRYNARAVSRFRKLRWSPLMQRAAEVRQGLIQVLQGLPDQEVHNPAHRYPVSAWLPEFAWTHEQSHRRRIARSFTS